jgi:hypothetical protein
VRIAKPMILVMTPVGMAWGLIEAARFHWWLAVLMAALFTGVAVLVGKTVRRIRVERHEAFPPERDEAWHALSELFVDTEHSTAELEALGRRLRSLGIHAATLENILREEVAPVAGLWMRWPTVGPWPSFDRDHLAMKIRAHIARPWFAPPFGARTLASYPGIAEDWGVVRGALEEKASPV